MKPIIFKDRAEAGRLLAAALTGFSDRGDLVVLGLPRGGVPVAFEVASRLHAPLDVLVVRKLGVPGESELAMGAVASGGVRLVDYAMVQALGVSPAALDSVLAGELAELTRREMLYRGVRRMVDLHKKVVILVDDGIATGSTMRAAVQAVRQQAPEAIMVAAPAASSEAADLLGPLVEKLVILETPHHFRSVGRWYENFSQVPDTEVIEMLSEATKHHPPCLA